MASDPKTLTIVVPVDLAGSIAHAIERQADWFRRDTGHAPDDVASLQRDADRLDEIAQRIRGDVEARKR